MDKILTVSVAAYNIENDIKQTLDSLIVSEDLMKLLEVIVVDDGSKDSTVLKAKAYEEKYPDTFKVILKENGGYGSTINTSVKEARGKYFKQLDGGDVYITENLEDFIKYLASTDADVVVSPHEKYYQLDNKSEINNDYASYGRSETLKIEEVTFGSRLWMHGLAFKTEVWLNAGKEIPEHCFYTDMEYVLYPFIKAKTIAFYDKSIYKYFLQCEGQSVSTEGLKKHYTDATRMMWDVVGTYNELIKTGEMAESVNALYEMMVNHAIAFTYTVYSYLDGNHKEEYKEMDMKLKKEYPAIYEKTLKVKRLKLMRNTGFGCASLYRKMFKI